MRRQFLLALATILAGNGFAAAQETRPPNIIIILADDLGWTDVGCQGSKYYETPNIDKLASQGLRLTSYYHSQNCAPTRAALMTGQTAPRTGVYTVGTLERGDAANRKMDVPANVTQLPLDRKTMGDVMKDSGYATAIYGKWHLGEKGGYHPGKRGFDEAITSQGKHFGFATNPKVPIPEGAYLADFLTDHAEKFIEKNKARPFFLYLSHFGVHSPWDAKKELVEKYQKKKGANGHDDPVYAAMIESIDQSVGRVLAKLAELKLEDNTIVLFMSDNGGVGGYQAAGVNARSITNNFPLRGGKGMLYEGGLRVPFIIRWPGHIPPGKSSDQPAVHVDLMPTFIEIAGKKAMPKQPLDGVSLVKLLKNPDTKLERPPIYFHFPGYLEAGKKGWRTTPACMMRSGDFTLLEFFEDNRVELYNVKIDLSQKVNLAKKLPEKTKELHDQLVRWRTDMNAAMPMMKKVSTKDTKNTKGESK
jgi:arylsulfatase A-like enzyme